MGDVQLFHPQFFELFEVREFFMLVKQIYRVFKQIFGNMVPPPLFLRKLFFKGNSTVNKRGDYSLCLILRGLPLWNSV